VDSRKYTSVVDALCELLADQPKSKTQPPTFFSVGMRIRVQLILRCSQPESTVRIEGFLGQARQELFEEPSSVDTGFFLSPSYEGLAMPRQNENQTYSSMNRI
jgi:hypothetical protein